MMRRKILVIKLGALGDFIQALGPMSAIRKHHKEAHITLLTTKPFKSFATDCNYFDDIWIDEKPGKFNPARWWALRRKLNKAHFTRVYDLQNNDRTNLYSNSSAPNLNGVAQPKVPRTAIHRQVARQAMPLTDILKHSRSQA